MNNISTWPNFSAKYLDYWPIRKRKERPNFYTQEIHYIRMKASFCMWQAFLVSESLSTMCLCWPWAQVPQQTSCTYDHSLLEQEFNSVQFLLYRWALFTIFPSKKRSPRCLTVFVLQLFLFLNLSNSHFPQSFYVLVIQWMCSEIFMGRAPCQALWDTNMNNIRL